MHASDHMQSQIPRHGPAGPWLQREPCRNLTRGHSRGCPVRQRRMLSFKAEAQQEDQGQEDKNGSEASSSNSTFEYLSLLIGGTTEGQGDQEESSKQRELAQGMTRLDADGQSDPQKVGFEEGEQASPSTSESGLYSPPMAQPRVTYVLLGANLVLYLVGIGIALQVGGEASNQWFLSLAKSNDALQHGETWRLLTSVFMHAGILHLGLNTLALYQLGPEAEAVLGPNAFLAVYLLSGLSGSVASFVTSPKLVTVGASGAIFGLLGAIAAYIFKNRKQLTNSNRQLVNILGIVAANVLLGLGGGNIDNAGHVGGLAAGIILGLGMCPLYVVEHPEGDKRKPGSVVDRVSSQQRIATAASFAVVLSLLYISSLSQSLNVDSIQV